MFECAMGEILAALASILILSAAVAALVIGRRRSALRRDDERERSKNSDASIYKDHNSASASAIRAPKTSPRLYQYISRQKVDALYEQVVQPGQRPATTTTQVGSSNIAQTGETLGPHAELSSVQRVEVLRRELQTVDVATVNLTDVATGTQVFAHGQMLMKHAVLPVYHGDATPSQAVWIGRLDSGRFVCLGGSAANVDPAIPRGTYLNSGVAMLLQAIRTAHDRAIVPYQHDVRVRAWDGPDPLHEFPGAWDAEVADVWAHVKKLHAHRVRFLAQIMTSSELDVERPRYDVVVGSPIWVEFAG